MIGQIGSAILGGIFGNYQQRKQFGYNRALIGENLKQNYDWQPAYHRQEQDLDRRSYMTAKEKSDLNRYGIGAIHDYQKQGHQQWMTNRSEAIRLGAQANQYEAERGEILKRTRQANVENLSAEKRSMEQRTSHYQGLGLTPQEILGAGNPGYGGAGASAVLSNIPPPKEKPQGRGTGAGGSVGQSMAALEAARLALDEKKTNAEIGFTNRRINVEEKLAGLKADQTTSDINKTRAETAFKRLEHTVLNEKRNLTLRQMRATIDKTLAETELLDKKFIIAQTYRKMASENVLTDVELRRHGAQGLDLSDDESIKNATQKQWDGLINALRANMVFTKGRASKELVSSFEVIKSAAKGVASPQVWKDFVSWFNKAFQEWKDYVSPPKREFITITPKK